MRGGMAWRAWPGWASAPEDDGASGRVHLKVELGRCILHRMTKVLTIRIDADLLGKAEARAARLGLDRAKYVRSLIEEDLSQAPAAPSRTFASEDLAGIYEGNGHSATNTVVRERMRRRAMEGETAGK